MSLLELGPVLFGGVERIITFPMCLMAIAGGVGNAKHGSQSRMAVFFSKSKLILQKWLLPIYLWARDCPMVDAIDEAEVDSRIAVDVMQWLREVCSTKLLQTPIILGGPVVIVPYPMARQKIYGNYPAT